MLVSHINKFIYTKTVKTAGTSVESYFEPCCMESGTWTADHYREASISPAGIIGFRGESKPPDCIWYHHMPAKKIRAQLGEEIWSEYYKFCVIRDPFDKAVSAFYYFWRNRETPRPGRRMPLLKRMSLLVRRGGARSLSEEFELWLESGNLPVDRDKYMIDGAICLDGFIRYEALNEGLSDVCSRVGVPFEPERLPTFKSGIRDTSVEIAQIYSRRSIEIVSNLYDFELDYFGYRAPVPRA